MTRGRVRATLDPMPSPKPRPQTRHLKPAKKGEVRNPLGITSPPAVAPVRALSREMLADIGAELLTGNIDVLDEIAECRVSPAIKVLLARVYQRAWAKGDHKAMVALIEQLVGKPKQTVDVNLSGHALLFNLVNVVEGKKPKGEPDE